MAGALGLDIPPRGTVVRHRYKGRTYTGKTTGGWRGCACGSPSGFRVGVRWEDGSLTWPCLKGMAASEGWSVGA